MQWLAWNSICGHLVIMAETFITILYLLFISGWYLKLKWLCLFWVMWSIYTCYAQWNWQNCFTQNAWICATTGQSLEHRTANEEEQVQKCRRKIGLKWFCFHEYYENTVIHFIFQYLLVCCFIKKSLNVLIDAVYYNFIAIWVWSVTDESANGCRRHQRYEYSLDFWEWTHRKHRSHCQRIQRIKASCCKIICYCLWQTLFCYLFLTNLIEFQFFDLLMIFLV